MGGTVRLDSRGHGAGETDRDDDIASNVELLEDGRSGRLVPPDDPSRLADAILEIAGDLGKATRYGESARERFERDFTEQAMKDSLWRLYDELIREGGGKAWLG